MAESMRLPKPVPESAQAPGRLAALFGGLGLIPFWAPLIVPFAAPALGRAAEAGQVIYAALILSFLGGARFGRAVDAAGAGRTVALSMLPTLYAFAVIGAPAPFAGARSALLALGLILQWLWDARTMTLPPSYRRLRTVLTAGAALALLAGAALFSQAA
jgi:hypothetical protein